MGGALGGALVDTGRTGGSGITGGGGGGGGGRQASWADWSLPPSMLVLVFGGGGGPTGGDRSRNERLLWPDGSFCSPPWTAPEGPGGEGHVPDVGGFLPER